MRELPWVAGFLGRPLTEPWRGERARIRAIVRGVALAAPMLIVLGLLLASGDAVFASLFSIDLRPRTGVAGHASPIVVGRSSSSVRSCSGRERPDRCGPATSARPIGPTEAGIVLGAITALYGVYVVTQLVVVAGGARHILETADLTRAEYARAGFFQLLWAAGLTLDGAARACVGTTVRIPRTPHAPGSRRCRCR